MILNNNDILIHDLDAKNGVLTLKNKKHFDIKYHH